jgi:uncharacterized membrane-anchored protein
MFEPHEHREALLDELHARPRPLLDAPSLVTRLDIQVEPKDMKAHGKRLNEHVDVDPEARHAAFQMGGFEVAFERRTEFVTYTIIDPSPAKTPFSAPAVDPGLKAILAGLPGKLVSAIRLHLSTSESGAPDHKICNSVFGKGTYAASLLRGGMASVASDFKPDENGFIRFVVVDGSDNPATRGRMVQRILEMEAYRAAAMLALPLARGAGGELDKLEKSLDEVSDRIAAGPHTSKDRDILQRLTTLAGKAERLRSEGDYRFAAARAYGDLVADRNMRLREERVEGHERVGVFIERRLNPALQTCKAVSERQHALAQRVDRAVRLLTTRVQVDLEDKNAGVLDAMNRRAAAQLRLQEAVEALSTVAMTYYGVGLIHYLAKGGQELGWPINPALVAGATTPVLFFGIWFGLRFVRRLITGSSPSK